MPWVPSRSSRFGSCFEVPILLRSAASLATSMVGSQPPEGGIGYEEQTVCLLDRFGQRDQFEGGAIPGVQITAVNVATAPRSLTSKDFCGTWLDSGLPAGDSDVLIESTGSRRLLQYKRSHAEPLQRRQYSLFLRDLSPGRGFCCASVKQAPVLVRTLAHRTASAPLRKKASYETAQIGFKRILY